jgi:hypothetical protein
MTSDSKNTIQIACMLGHRAFSVTSVEFQTPDGRTWSADAQSDGGYRLFEIDPDGRKGPDEHDAVEGNTWTASELIDYLAAVGEAKR